MGEFVFHCGVMGTGKSVIVIMQAYNFRKKNLDVRILKPGIDTRTSNVWSRALDKGIPCEIVKSIRVKDFKNDKDHPVIIVDECQFITKADASALAVLSDSYDKIVHCYGLLADRNQKMFTGAKALLEVGAEYHSLKTQCQVYECRDYATHHVYYNPDTGLPDFSGGQVKIGSDPFKSVCGHHYRQIRKFLSPWENVR